jgi:putative hydrolase of the HAD superfamily
MPFKAISFDLDDTLYSNGPVMAGIEQKMISHFAQLMPQYKQIFNSAFWFYFKQQAIKQQSELAHDVVFSRLESYCLGFISLGFTEEAARSHAQTALEYFIQLRSEFKVPEKSQQLLAKLSEKLPLVAISNGNVNTETLGIGKYFTHIYHAGYQQVIDNSPVKGTLLRQKPEKDMFVDVCKKLAILPEELLHVGDCGNADIYGALSAGCQAVFLPHYGVGKPLKVIPHLELNDVCDLEKLI